MKRSSTFRTPCTIKHFSHSSLLHFEICSFDIATLLKYDFFLSLHRPQVMAWTTPQAIQSTIAKLLTYLGSLAYGQDLLVSSCRSLWCLSSLDIQRSHETRLHLCFLSILCKLEQTRHRLKTFLLKQISNLQFYFREKSKLKVNLALNKILEYIDYKVNSYLIEYALLD